MGAKVIGSKTNNCVTLEYTLDKSYGRVMLYRFLYIAESDAMKALWNKVEVCLF